MRLALAAALFLAPAAGAQTTIQECAKLTMDEARLKCYDAVAAATTGAPAAPVTPVNPMLAKGWRFERKADPMKDTATLIASIMADEQAGILMVRCSDGKDLEIYANWLKFLGMERAQVTWRFDAEKPESGNWSLSTDKKAAFASDPMKIHVPMTLGAKKLALQTTPYSSSPVTMTFDLTAGDQKALGRVLFGCGVLRKDPDAE